jgi:Na+/proline symporter
MKAWSKPAPTSAATHSPDDHLRRGAGVAALVGAGLLHAFITPEYVKEKFYIGASFGISFVLCSIVGVWLWRKHDRNAWIAGAMLSGGMILGFLVSRTIGLPGFNESGVWEHWTEGFPSLAAEVAFLGLSIRPIMAPAASTRTSTVTSAMTERRVLASR